LKKAFYILFSLYFITLAAIPCGDKDDCNEPNCTTQTAQNQHEDHQDEACTPFCVCSCCATHYVNNSATNQIVIASIEVKSYHDAPTSKVMGAVLPIWQPPKLA
jgi:hypothetical protein